MTKPNKWLASGAAMALAAAVIIKWEGQRFVPYRDPVGVLTVCYGHTGPDVIEGKRYTLAECKNLLQHDQAIAYAIVQRCLPMPKPEHVQAALVSATFNIGPRVVCGSTLQRLALAGDWPGACAQLERWKYAQGRVLRGLVLRRADERALCEGRPEALAEHGQKT